MKLVDRKTGAIVDVPDEQAQAAFMSGQYGVPKGAPMPVKTPGLVAGTVDPSQARSAFTSGVRVASEGEYRKGQQEARYGGPGAAVAAAGVGAARGAAGALGVPFDAAVVGGAEMLGIDSFVRADREVDPYAGERTVLAHDALRERLQGYSELHPVASVVGELGGMIGAAALTGGGVLGTVGAGAKALVGRGVAGSIARTAAEGALFGGLGAVNEAALGDTKLTAAKVMASVGHGAIIGGALGGTLHLGGEAVAGMRDRFGRWVSSLRPGDIEKVAEGHFGYAPKGLGERVKDAVARARGGVADDVQQGYARAASAASGKDVDVIERLTALTPEGAEARRIAVFDAPKVIEDAERKVRGQIDGILSADNLVSAEARGELKSDYVRRAVKNGNEGEVLEFAKKRLDMIEAGIDAQLEQEMAPSMLKSAKTVKKLVERAREIVGKEKTVGHVPFIDPDAGLGGGFRRANPLSIGEELRPMVMKSGGRADRIAVEEAPGLWPRGAKGQILKRGKLNLDAGLAEGSAETEQAFRWTAKKTVPKGVELNATDAESVVTSRTRPIKFDAQKASATDNAEVFIAFDNLKRGMQRLTSTGYRSIRLIADPVDQLNARRTVSWLDGAAQDVRMALEDDVLWGKAAIDQRAINASWTKQIDASKRFHRALTTEVGRDPNNPYLEVRGADPAKVAGYVKNLTNPNNDLTHKAVREYVESTRELSESIAKSYDLPADKLAEVVKVKDAAAAFKATIDDAETSLVTANQYKALLNGPEQGSVAGSLGLVGGVLGGLPGGVLGTIAGAAINAVRQPAKVIAQMAAIERLVSKVDHQITNGVRSFLSGAKGGAASKEIASVKILEGKGGERSVFETKVREVQRLAVNQEELVGRVQQFTSQFGEAAPSVATALTAATIKGVEYLARTAPPGFTPRPEALAWGVEEAPLYTDAEMRTWARRAAVVHDPMNAVASMKKKMLTPEEADALRVVHAPIFERLQNEFRAQRTKKPGRLPYGQALQIELMFDVPLNRTLERDFMRDVQMSFGVAERKAPSPKRLDAGGLGAGSRTTAQRIAGGMR